MEFDLLLAGGVTILVQILKPFTKNKDLVPILSIGLGIAFSLLGYTKDTY